MVSDLVVLPHTELFSQFTESNRIRFSDFTTYGIESFPDKLNRMLSDLVVLTHIESFTDELTRMVFRFRFNGIVSYRINTLRTES